MSDFGRIIELAPAWDHRHSDPAKNYGSHGVDLRMILTGAEGATQFLLFTGWVLPETLGLQEPESWYLGGWGPQYAERLADRFPGLHPSPADLGYHSRRPIYDGQEQIDDSCPYVPGGRCYYDGSGLNAYRIFDVLLREGSDGVWRELEAYYQQVFAREEATAE